MKVAVFGAGTMGSGIAQVFAQKGHDVLLFASSPASAQKHKDKLAASLEKRVQKGKLDAAVKESILAKQGDVLLVPGIGAYGLETRKELGEGCLAQMLGGVDPFFGNLQAF